MDNASYNNQYNQYGHEDSQFSNLSQVSHHHSNSNSKIQSASSSQKKLYYNDSMFPPI